MRENAWLLFFLLLLAGAGTHSMASGAPASFDQSNRFYEEGKYNEAIAGYESLLKSGKVSAAILFNLGNAYFKNGQLGRAIYNYRRAGALSPRDPDIQANLHFARDRINGSASVLPAPWQHLIHYFTLNELSVVAATCFWVLLSLLAALRWRPVWHNSLRPYLWGTALILVAAVSLLSTASAQETVAIAIQSQVPIHLGPISESQAAFTVPDGTELRVENRRDNWLQVADRSNRSGWVEAGQVAVWPAR
jgi:tetratricopeptide (TPR) repeat protein